MLKENNISDHFLKSVNNHSPSLKAGKARQKSRFTVIRKTKSEKTKDYIIKVNLCALFNDQLFISGVVF